MMLADSAQRGAYGARHTHPRPFRRRSGAPVPAAETHGARELARQEFTFGIRLCLALLVFLVMTGYYREPRVLASLGLEDRPPFPKGHAVAESDFTGLDAVRRRGKLYREC